MNNFFKKYPTKDLAKPHINLDLIHSILTRHIFNFELTSKTFNFLNEIEKHKSVETKAATITELD